MQNDRFEKIAEIQSKCNEDLLVTPEPLLNDAETVKLFEYNEAYEYNPPKKAATKEELLEELDALRESYVPYMSVFSPKPQVERTQKYINEYDWRLETSEDIGNLEFVSKGKGLWERVTIPHYGGPIGIATAYYRTEFVINENDLQAGSLFICFKGADYKAHIFVNSCYVGSHEGFFSPFEFDITSLVKIGSNVLFVKLENDNIQMGCDECYIEKILTGDKIYAATGPGWDDPANGWHHCPPGMGIYNKVYIEARSRIHIQDIFVRPLNKEGDAEVWVDVFMTYSDIADVEFSLSVYGKNFEHIEFENLNYIPELLYNEKMIRLPAEKGYNRFVIPFKIDHPRLWGNQTPWLYTINIELSSQGNQTDAMQRHFGVRTFEQSMDSVPKGKFTLNGKPIKLRGANTMGFEQQDVMKGDFDRLRDDILLAKLCNMNFLRITQRPVQSEIYDYCDMLGLMIQTDLPMFGVVRINQYSEVIRQAGEMERLIRSHPCCILSTYMNEPFPDCHGKPNRHLNKKTMRQLFEAADSITRLNNPDRVIKHVDGDYDPPANSMPDNHCYTMWYNGHGIDIGMLMKGYWQNVLAGWCYGCGEFGVEGLEIAEVMRKYYPASWLPKNDEEVWTPSKILAAQTGRMYTMFFDTPNTLHSWIEQSQEHQSFANKLMTEAFRRDDRMISFAIHLFIDAFPSGWMKAIMDCERNPKKSYFTYKNALEPILANLRSDRLTCFSQEELKVEAWICNDLATNLNTKMRCIVECNGEKLYSIEKDVAIEECKSKVEGNLLFKAPVVNKRSELIIKMGLLDENSNVINDTSLTIEVFPKLITSNLKVCALGEKANIISQNINAELKSPEEADVFLISELGSYYSLSNLINKKVNEGAKVIFICLEPGKYQLFDAELEVRKSYTPFHFASRNTKHKLVEEYRQFDFRLWYDNVKDRITPIADTTFKCDAMMPVLLAGVGTDSVWENVVAEMNHNKGRVILCQAFLENHLCNPIAREFIYKMLNF